MATATKPIFACTSKQVSSDTGPDRSRLRLLRTSSHLKTAFVVLGFSDDWMIGPKQLHSYNHSIM